MKKKKKYINCTIKDDGNGAIIEFNANGRELIAMICSIIFYVAENTGIDIEQFLTLISEMVVNVTKSIKDKKEEFRNEDYVF